MIKLWKNYCEQTTLHGFQYFSKSNLCLAEKIFWTFVLISAMIASSFSLKKLLNEIEKNPTIMYQSEIPKSVTDIPFPSFTYCPGMKPREKLPSLEYIENLLKMQQNGQNLTEEE
jgi:acid-sensing ion channel, other